jgi:hypothetical protein
VRNQQFSKRFLLREADANGSLSAEGNTKGLNFTALVDFERLFP